MRKKTDVTFLCQYFFPEYISSATLPFDVARALVETGFSVSALCGYPKEYYAGEKVPRKEIAHGIAINRIKYIQLGRKRSLSRLMNYFSFTMGALMHLRQLGRSRIIVVYSNPPILPIVAILANVLFRVKLVFVSFDVYPEIAQAMGSVSRKSIIVKMMNFINRSLFKRASKVVAMSYEMKSYLEESRKQTSSDQIVVIPNWHHEYLIEKGNDLDLDAHFARHNLNHKFLIAYLGNLGVCQELETIYGAIHALLGEAGIMFLFVGHGSKMAQLKGLVTREGLSNVVVWDYIKGQAFERLLARCDCFLVTLMPGISKLAAPSKTYSYMKAGKPIIAVMDQDADIVEDLVTFRAGIPVKIGDISGLVKGIMQLRENSTLRSEMGANAKCLEETKYNIESSLAKYVRLIEEIV